MARRPIITHEVKLVGFDEPLIPKRLVRRGLRRAGTIVEDELEKAAAEHHDTGQLEKSAHQNPVDMKDQSVTVRFKGKRAKVRHRRRKDGSQGKEYRRFNKTVAFFLNFFKKFYDRKEESIKAKAVEGFSEEIAKKG